MTGGGPNKATNTLVYYIYEFRTTNIGYASATGVVLMAAIGLLTVLYFRLLSKSPLFLVVNGKLEDKKGEYKLP